MISAIKRNPTDSQLSLNVIVSEVKDGVIIYEPVSKLFAFGEHSYEAKDIIREKIINLCTLDYNAFSSLFSQSKADEKLKLFVITLEKAIAESGLVLDNVDVTTLNLTVCKLEDITQTNLASL